MGLKVRENGSFVDVGGSAPSGEWVRNKAWPELIEPAPGTQEVKGLFAVFPGDSQGLNYNFKVQLQGAYTVDVGDGSAPVNVASNAFYSYNYDFDNANLYDATVTLTDSGNLVTRNGHGYSDGDTVRFYRIASTTGLTEGQDYYVINATTNTFQVATSADGNAVTLTTDGSAALLPYKIATVSITPQAGQNLTLISLSAQQSWTGGGTANWLEVVIRAPNCTSLPRASSSSAARLRLCERFAILEHNATDFSQLCNGMQALGKFEVNSATGVTNFSSMFSSCSNLRQVPLFDTSSGLSFSSMFSGCNSLRLVPPFNTSLGTTFSSMFNNCSSLRAVPLLDTSNGTTVASMFYLCTDLRFIPTFDLSSATSIGSFLQYCHSLAEVPPLVFRSDATGAMNVQQACLQRYRAIGPYVSFAISKNSLSADALNEIYTNLPVVVGQTITVSENPGTDGDDPTIATAKGWTVTG